MFYEIPERYFKQSKNLHDTKPLIRGGGLYPFARGEKAQGHN